MKKKFLVAIILSAFLVSCGVYNSLMNISRLKFKLDSVSNFKLSGIPVNNKSSLKDFNALDLVKLSSQITSGSLPVTFILNVDAKNPNGNSTGNPADITLEKFPWKLFIDNKETISGNILKPVKVPAAGGTSVIPLNVNFDLVKVFGNLGIEKIINMALKLGGQKSSTSHIKIIADPVLGTPLGNMKYPSSITIIDKEFH